MAGRAPLGTRQLLLVNLLTDMLPALAVALARSREQKSGEDPLVGGPASALFGSDLWRILAVRGSATALGAAAAWQCGRMTGRARRASTMGLAALVGTQLGQTFMTDWHSPWYWPPASPRRPRCSPSWRPRWSATSSGVRPWARWPGRSSARARPPPLWGRPSRHGCSSPGRRRSRSERITRETGYLRRFLT
ncbi:hypothetical protein SSPO_015980 [Streptomyces antimycoticus]|uniref:Cation-transporting P-type ATPase C-terminal domain-containing protein n=1 Tax=Streptomyces antimycoticus TaxID=68175 RepID=A0A499UFR3_9ACTN|nr:hypothetical protein SSPO_015980 [Streptomyces antimycoticus]